MIQARRPVLHEGAGVRIDPWPDPSTINIDLDVYFEAPALLEGERKSILPCADSEQAVTAKIFSFSSWSPCTATPNIVERDPQGDGVDPERRDATQRPVRLKPPDPRC